MRAVNDRNNPRAIRFGRADHAGDDHCVSTQQATRRDESKANETAAVIGSSGDSARNNVVAKLQGVTLRDVELEIDVAGRGAERLKAFADVFKPCARRRPSTVVREEVTHRESAVIVLSEICATEERRAYFAGNKCVMTYRDSHPSPRWPYRIIIILAAVSELSVIVKSTTISG